MDTHEFIINSTSHSVEELAPYEGQHVAWSEDGKEILLAARVAGDEQRRLPLARPRRRKGLQRREPAASGADLNKLFRAP